jgi:hypothetical protein
MEVFACSSSAITPYRITSGVRERNHHQVIMFSVSLSPLTAPAFVFGRRQTAKVCVANRTVGMVIEGRAARVGR